MKVVKIIFKILFFPLTIFSWILRDTKKKYRLDLDTFLAVPPVITDLPSDIEIKKMERTKTGWRVYYGKKGRAGSDGSANLDPSVTGFSVPGGVARVNGR